MLANLYSSDIYSSVRKRTESNGKHRRCAGEIPRKGGLGITRCDLLIINKTDLAPHVRANLEVMAQDAKRMRGTRPFVFTNLRTGEGVETVVAFIRQQGLLDQAGGAG